MKFGPMLASKADLKALTYPLFGSPKVDGIRALVRERKLVTRKLLPIPNLYIRSLLENKRYEGFDGELTVGQPFGEGVYARSSSGVMTIAGQPDFTFWAFDIHDAEGYSYERRLELLMQSPSVSEPAERVRVLPQRLIRSEDELLAFYADLLDRGYEGAMVRRPKAPYKFGRSTVDEGYLLKLKPRESSEAEVLGVVEEMANLNEATKDNLGRTKRSSAKAGKVGKGTMGALKVRDIHTGVEFEIGTGFTAADRKRSWPRGTLVTYEHCPIGVKDKPRHPSYKGIRDRRDL